MTKPTLTEKVAKALCWVTASYDDLDANAQAQWRHDARRAIRTVLEHFSDPGNVTKAMRQSCPINCNDAAFVKTIAAAMKAAREEME